ncbi:hypothetical protein BZZ01_00255 [Nostocales cyanobacterium HT-58-2]|nr:hypothetical protein BZZ01_00255 [Nostocales cyanobacterium HT-58-2]
MKRILFVGLSAITTFSLTAFPVLAQSQISPSQEISTTFTTYKAPASEISPNNLVFLAYRGALGSKGIPSYVNLLQAFYTGEVTAAQIVKSAVETNKLPVEMMSDESYISAVRTSLL